MRPQKQAKTAVKQQKLWKKVQQRLSIQYIYRELDLIPHMNRHLEIPLKVFNNMDILQHLSSTEVLTIVEQIPYLKKREHPLTREVFVKIQYQNAGKLLLVTGIQKEYVQTFLQQFNNSIKFGRIGMCGKINHYNSFWICLETANEQAANMLKKYLRNEKRNLDETTRKPTFKIEKRRVRIIIVKEDLFTLLVDAMTQSKADIFNLRFLGNSQQLPLEKKKSQEMLLADGKNVLVYRPLPTPYSGSNYSIRNDTRQQQLSDGFSESTSLNSDLFDPNKMKDIIQTSDQGIQSESNIHFKTQNQPYKANSMKNSEEVPQRSKQQIKKEELLERKHEEEVIKKSEIMRSQSQQYGLCINQNSIINQPVLEQQKQEVTVYVEKEKEEVSQNQIKQTSGQKQHKQQNIQLSLNELKQHIKTQLEVKNKIISETAIYTQDKIYNKEPQNLSQPVTFQENSVQTLEPLYSVVPIAVLRRCLAQYRNRGHSDMIELPSWLKSQTQNERNRHRFFSSLCRPKIIHRNRHF